MISLNGKAFIKRYLAGQASAIAQCISWGIGDKVEAAGDYIMHFESGRADITLTSYDFVNDVIIFKAVLPDDYSGKIYEIGLWSMNENPNAGNYSSKVLASFDSVSEVWVKSSDGSAALYSPNHARLGDDSLTVTPDAGQTTSFILNDLVLDLSGNSGADVFKFAYFIGSDAPVMAPATITFKFRTDASNYYYYTVTDPAAGYRIDQLLKGNASVVGTPTWAMITGIEISVKADAAGPSLVDFDGIRIEDTDTVNPDYCLVSRKVLATPYTKIDGQTQEIEFSLKVNV